MINQLNKVLCCMHACFVAVKISVQFNPLHCAVLCRISTLDLDTGIARTCTVEAERGDIGALL